MRLPRRALTVLFALSITTFIFGCMEEQAGEGIGDSQGKTPTDKGDVTQPKSAPPMDVEITNIEYQFKEYDDPFRLPDLSITCDAINYGGSGRTTVVLVAAGKNCSAKIERVAQVKENGQIEIKAWGKLPSEPINITGYSKRNSLSILTGPDSSDMDVEVANLFYDVPKWYNVTELVLDMVVFVSATNYGQPGHITVVLEVEGEGYTKTVEERIHLNWYQQADLRFNMRVPGPPVNLTAYTKRAQKDE